MSWNKAAPLSELQEKQRLCATINDHKILLIWHKDKVHAVASQCPHLKLPLKKGKVNDDGAIVCPFHKSAFALEDGQVLEWSPWPPVAGKLLGKISKPKPLPVFPVKVEEDTIYVELP